MDRYQRVEKPKDETPIGANEIRITSQGRMRSYITYALTLLQEKGADEIVFKAMGRAINKTVTIVELIKRRVVGLHQITSIGSTDITDIWEPLEEGLVPLETTRHVSMITITLSKKELETSTVGYQTPLAEDMVKPAIELEHEGEESPQGQGRGMGRGGQGRGRARGNGYITPEYENGGWDQQGGGYMRGRGRGRSFRGRGREGYNVPQDDFESYNERPSNFRGRGRRGGFRGGYDGPPRFNDYDGGYNEGPGNFRGRGRRGGYGGPPRSTDHDDYDGDYNEGPGNFRGRGRRGGYNGPSSNNHDNFGAYNEEAGHFRGRGSRGGYSGPRSESDAHDEYGGYNQEAASHGRGRGRARGRARGARSYGPSHPLTGDA